VLPAVKAPLCVSTDAVVEGVHFLRQTPRFDVGYKALAVNLSDLAAMGARPRWFVCALAAPSLTKQQVSALGRGMAALARRFRIALVGGNVTRARQLSLTLTVLGTAVGKGPLLRSTAQVGDSLYVSGTLGAARLGLTSVGRRYPAAVRRQRRPEPRVALGLLAASYASAAIDVSDGFVNDVGRMLSASGVGAAVQTARLPIDSDVRAAFARPSAALRMALIGGEDYELVLAVPRRRRRAFERACARARQPVTEVGRLISAPGLRLVDGSGRALALPKPGYQHF
jgi:thiamine-monophosphate kinase